MSRTMHDSRTTLAGLILATLTPQILVAQFDQTPVPAQMQSLEFMVGDWTVTGAFRTPDHIGTDRTLWYLTRGGGITRFDGQSWTAFTRGQSALADSLLDQTTIRAEPFAFSNDRTVKFLQDGFALLIDEGRTSGSIIVFFDTERSAWVATQFHGPTNGVSTSTAPDGEGPPVFEGQGVDRRGERIYRRRYEVHGAGHYTIRTDVSFDDGRTWIDDQIVQEVRRRSS